MKRYKILKQVKLELRALSLELAAEQELEQYWDIGISVESRKILPVVSASSCVIRNYLSHLPQTVIELIT